MIDGVPSSNALDSGSYTSRIFGVTLSEQVVPDSDNNVGFTDASLGGGSERGNAEYVDPMSAVLNSAKPIEIDDFPTDHEKDSLLDGTSKLPTISDVLWVWEQFLTTSTPSGDTDEINLSSPENGSSCEHELLLGQDNGWDGIQHMNHLTEQMGLLTSNGQTG
ncbi:hypothetical protein V6N12_024468 [Hibiscus sabdariffa]|uniref:Uncharacterized protein n=1 Tax=Hibiscus sabdariffa TaxID=183260 RepID=A0ABR2G0Q1_9ROSI